MNKNVLKIMIQPYRNINMYVFAAGNRLSCPGIVSIVTISHNLVCTITQVYFTTLKYNHHFAIPPGTNL